jgi:ribosomal protein L11 methyltransferase
VPHERAEESRALLLDLVPQGFEEIERGRELELAAYVEADVELSLRRAFSHVEAADVPPGWTLAWRRFHRPVRVGPLWIGPPWERPPPDALAVVIDPGQAFGTGSHPTTRLCLELLLEVPPTGVLDVGCGSGVLAIAAAKLGFGPVVALDCDPAAVAAAHANAGANGVDLDVRLRDAVPGRLPDAELALANLDRPLVERLAARRSPAAMIASGFLASDRLEFPGRDRIDRRELDGWAAELLRRRRSASARQFDGREAGGR